MYVLNRLFKYDPVVKEKDGHNGLTGSKMDNT